MTPTEILAARDRFWSHVGARNESGCRLWDGSLYQNGYAQFRVRLGLNTRGHRFAWLCRGTPTQIRKRLRAIRGKCVRHTCDVRACCEPRHLRPGTCQQNADDAMRRGRLRRGARHYAAKLTPQKVVLLRKMAADGVPLVNLEHAFGVHRSNVSRIVRRLSYAEVA